MKKFITLALAISVFYACSEKIQENFPPTGEVSSELLDPNGPLLTLDPLDPRDPIEPRPEPPTVTTYAKYIYPNETIRFTAASRYPEATFEWFVAAAQFTPVDGGKSIDVSFSRPGTYNVNCTAAIYQKIGFPAPPILGKSDPTIIQINVVNERVTNRVWLENKYVGNDFYLRLASDYPVYKPHPDHVVNDLRAVYVTGTMKAYKLDQAGRIGEEVISLFMTIPPGETGSDWINYGRIVDFSYPENVYHFRNTQDHMFNYNFTGFHYRLPEVNGI